MTELWDPRLAEDLYRFVMFIYPWGKENTPLASHKGPRKWQREELDELSEHLKTQKARMAKGLAPELWRKATASGRGPGKSSLVAWKDHWMRTTQLGSTVIITANTETQLKTRTFAEITKWNTLAINGHWFETTVLSVKPAEWFKKCVQEQLKIDTGYYYTQGQLWAEENPDAFAGIHNPLGVSLIMDEASGIPASIFKVAEGFFTEPVLHRFWDVYSNARRNSGGFYDCFHDHKNFWRTRQLDSRTVEGTDTALFDRMIEQYGEDSDTVRIEIRGLFPKQGSRQFISSGIVADAKNRELPHDAAAPLIMGVDIARYGDDYSVIRFRQGRDARSIPARRYQGKDNMWMANEIARLIDETNPDAVNIDAGNGTGVIDRLREMKYKVNEIWFGAEAHEKEWANRRTEMYAAVRDWLGGGCIDDSRDLTRDLTAPEYDYFGKAQDRIMLESKESMKNRGLPSTDDGDALAATFAVRVARKDAKAGTSNRAKRAKYVDGDVLNNYNDRAA